MKKIFLILLVTVFLIIPIKVSAHSETVRDMSMTLEYVDWYIFTKEKMYDEDLEALNFTEEGVLNYLKSNNLELIALLSDYDSDPSVELMVAVKNIPGEIDDLGEYSDEEIAELGDEVKNSLGVDSYEIKVINGFKFIYLNYYDEAAGENTHQYYTVYNNKGYTLFVRKPVEFTEDELKIINKSIDSISFEKETTKSNYLWLIIPIGLFSVLCLIIGIYIYYKKKKEPIKAINFLLGTGITLIILQSVSLSRIDLDYLFSANDTSYDNLTFVLGKISYLVGYLIFGIIGIILVVVCARKKKNESDNSKKVSKQKTIKEEEEIIEEIVDEADKKADTKKNASELSANDFGKYLAGMILINADTYSGLCKSIEVKENYMNHLHYLEYLLYISQCLLEKDYKNDTIKVIIDSSIDTIIESVNFIEGNSNSSIKKELKDYYKSIEKRNYNIFNEDGINKLVKLYELDLKLEADIITEQYIFLEFSNYISYCAKEIISNIDIFANK